MSIILNRDEHANVNQVKAYLHFNNPKAFFQNSKTKFSFLSTNVTSVIPQAEQFELKSIKTPIA